MFLSRAQRLGKGLHNSSLFGECRRSQRSFGDEPNRLDLLKQKFEQLKQKGGAGAGVGVGGQPNPTPRQHPPTHPRAQQQKIPGVKHLVAVASGKGGVGKSTVAVNLALAFEQSGLKTGLLDTDVYEPSVPIMMNLKSQRATANEFKFLVPLKNYNISCMSIGFLIPEDKPVIWRGPMVMGALQQMLNQVEWGELDVLVLDLPPGTGDTQLSLAQIAPLTGAVIVSTPQDLALADAIRGVNMFKTVNVPILGIVENMSYYHCPKCGNSDYIFANSGGPRVAADMNIPFLGKIPLHTSIRETTDSGKPIVVSDPSSPISAIYIDIAKQVWQKLEEQQQQQESPTIVFE